MQVFALRFDVLSVFRLLGYGSGVSKLFNPFTLPIAVGGFREFFSSHSEKLMPWASVVMGESCGVAAVVVIIGGFILLALRLRFEPELVSFGDYSCPKAENKTKTRERVN